jgi:2-polyprenyl-3-methyl-5-hydroxy-6-metoxy-1,4-benzoquinol methylase
MKETEAPPCAGAAKDASIYWERRARQFRDDAAAWRAVCSYGMPGFYNASIHTLQWLALRPWLDVRPGTRVLDVGCGVGRWSRRLARAGAHVTGVDLAPTMIDEATRRAAQDGVGASCHFMVGDLTQLALGRRFERAFGVTVLQHILHPFQLQRAVERLAAHLEPRGRLILLEAAPTRLVSRCNSPVFVAREERMYRAVFADAGLRCLAVRGVDPMPFKTWLLPRYAGWPRAFAVGLLLGATTLSFPFDVIAGRRLTSASWHKLFVLAHAGDRSGRTA